MATADALKVIEDHITCSICLEIYKDPHELNCRHTFCLNCIKGIRSNNVIPCPECRHPTDFKNIRKDFKANSLIDACQKEGQNHSPDEKNLPKCEMCKMSEKDVIYKCVECDNFMCENCNKIHQGLKVCKGHRVQTLAELSQAFHQNLQEKQKEMEQIQKEVIMKSEDIKRAINNIKFSEREQLHKLQMLKDEIIQKVQESHRILEKSVKSANDKVLQSLAFNQEICEQMKSEVESTMDFLCEIYKSEGIVTLTETMQTLNRDFRTQLDEVRLQLSKLNTNIISDVVVNGKEFIPERYMWVSVETTRKVAVQSLQQNDYSTLSNKTFKELKSNTGAAADSRRMYLINCNLWCAFYDGGLKVYNRDCALIKAITNSNLQKCAGLTKAYTGVIIVACENNGLHELCPAGSYLRHIGDGSYSDVCSYGEMLYVLDYKHCKVLVFNLKGDKWLRTNTFSLQYDNGDSWDKLCVTGRGIFVSSWKNNCVYTHTLKGKLLCSPGKKGSGEAGLFNGPVLCGVDISGNVLVCDNWNHRLQVYNQEKKRWSVIKLQGEIRGPFDVVLDPDGRYMWIASARGLVKYSNNDRYCTQ